MQPRHFFKLFVLSQVCGPQGVWAEPLGGQVVSGSAVITSSATASEKVTTIQQSTQKATLNWRTFNVAPDEQVKFLQPNASALTVNRISDPNGSRILGRINANGQVWLINPSGIYFGTGAQINVGGLLASTLAMPDTTQISQLKGMVTEPNALALVNNEGQIQIAQGGYAALLGNSVGNSGGIRAPGGRILLLGDKQNGRVSLSGRLDTQGPAGSGLGFIETSAARVNIANGSVVSTQNADGLSGTWLLDPTNFTIDSGSGASTTSSIGATTLSNSLQSSHVTIATDNSSGSDSGNIYVNSAISWSGATQLTLSAYKNIYIDAPITSSHSSGKLSLLFGQGSVSGTVGGEEADYYINSPVSLKAGVNFYTQLGSNAANLKSYQVLTSLGNMSSTTGTDLQGINGNKTGNYALGADIDAVATYGWVKTSTNKGFTKIGDNTTTADYYSGTFAGLGHVISNLYMYRPNNGVSGLFSTTSDDSVIRDVGLVNMNINTNRSGGLVGRHHGTIKNSFTTGSITSIAGFVGGLVGENQHDVVNGSGYIINSYSTASVTATTDFPAGGLVGYNRAPVVNSYASGVVTGSTGYTGGLFGALTVNGSVSNSVWNTTTSGQSSGYGSLSTGSGTTTGLSTTQMTQSSNFSSWNFTRPWIIYEGNTSPLLRAFMTPLTISASASGSQTYNGTTATSLASYTDPGTLSKTFSGSINFVLDGSGVGTHSVIASGFYSDQLGYQISYSFSTNSVTVVSQSSTSSVVPNLSALIPITSTTTSLLNVAASTENDTTTASTSTASTSASNTNSSANDTTASSSSPPIVTIAAILNANQPASLTATEPANAADSQQALPTDQQAMLTTAPTVTLQNQRNTAIPSISDGEKLPTHPTLSRVGLAGDLVWDNFGNKYSGEQRLLAHPQFRHLLTPDDALALMVMGSEADMTFKHASYEFPWNSSAWRTGWSVSHINYSLGGTAASLQAYGNASQQNLWLDRAFMHSEHTQTAWRLEAIHSDLNDMQDASGMANKRSMQMLSARFSASHRGNLLSPYQNWLNLAVSSGKLWFRDATAEIDDASFANTQGRFHKLNLSLGHVQTLRQGLSVNLFAQGQWSHANLDASQKMAFGGAQSIRAYQPGVLSADEGKFVRLEIMQQVTPSTTWPNSNGDVFVSVFAESGWLKVYRRPWSSVTDNHAKLSGAGVGLNWNGPNQWTVSTSLSRALGQTPTLLSGTNPLHTRAWFEIGKKFN